jgi:hypothetical protein
LSAQVKIAAKTMIKTAVANPFFIPFSFSTNYQFNAIHSILTLAKSLPAANPGSGCRKF